MIRVELHFYAQLRDFFADASVLDLPDKAVAADIRVALTKQNALAADWLKVSRLASEDAFLAEDESVENGHRYYLLPPSSGG